VTRQVNSVAGLVWEPLAKAITSVLLSLVRLVELADGTCRCQVLPPRSLGLGQLDNTIEIDLDSL